MNDEWIEHDGGECPVPGDTLVVVRYRDGSRDYEHGHPAWGFSIGNNWWKHEGRHETNITHYRIIKESST